MKKTPECVILLNYADSEIQELARFLRSKHIYCLVMPSTVSLERVLQEDPVGLIFCHPQNTDKADLAEKTATFTSVDLPSLQLILSEDETTATEKEKVLLFCHEKCFCQGIWKLENFVEESIADIREQVGDKKLILGLSGGVDSSVMAALLHKAIGNQLHCVFVDNGLLRKNEAENVQEIFARSFEMNLLTIDASENFLSKLQGISDPEEKRKIIGREFIEAFSEAAKKIEAPFLGQGTIYPDVLESIAIDGNPERVIKSHHNVGGLPEDLNFELVEPLKRLFKDEVRIVGKLLGLPAELIDRHPFPGPSLGVRHLGAIEKESLQLLREADAILIDELYKSGWYHKTWQTFAVFLPVKSVGMKNNKRTYQNVIAIRSVNSTNAVTAEIARLPWELLEKICNRIIDEVDGINRVVYDITAKPPGTIEWE